MMKIIIIVTLKILLSLLLYFVVFKSVEFITVLSIKSGMRLSWLLRPINKRALKYDLRITFPDIFGSFAWLMLGTCLILLLPISLLLFALNISFWKTLSVISIALFAISEALFFLDTAIFYSYTDRDLLLHSISKITEDIESGWVWKSYLHNQPFSLKKMGFARKYYK